MTALAVAVLCWTLGAAGALLLRRRAVAALLGAAGAVAGGGAAALASLRALVGAGQSWSAPWHVPAGALALRMDALAAVFLLPIGMIGAVGAVYGVAYLRHHANGTSIGGSLAAYDLLLLSMALVVSAANLVLLIVAWELMALSSWALVVSDHGDRDVRRAGIQYLVAGHLATGALLLLALCLAAVNGSFAVAPLARGAAISSGLLFMLALIGFGTKAGIVPLHVWLPDAHTAAPSHVSALMSAVMITMGFYGLCRFIPLLGTPALWWGYLLMGLGAVGMVGGILFSIAQRDVKRALAYSTVEHAGLVTLAMGVGLLGTVLHHPLLAGLAWTAALLHLWNHALAKSLLFLGFGVIAQRAGSRDLDAMGGFLSRWKVVGGVVVVGAAAIAALPGLNVFTSEWLLFRALLSGGLELGGADRVALLGSVVALAAAGALAVAGFARLVGIGLLGTPRTVAAAAAAAPGGAIRVPLLLLGAGCLVVAAIPGSVVQGLTAAVGIVAPAADLTAARSALAPVAMLLPALGALIVLILAVRAVVDRRALQRVGATWRCGYPAPTPRMQYTSTSFASGLTDIMQPVLHRDTSATAATVPSGVPVSHAAWPVAATWSTETADRLLAGVYLPLFAAVARAGERLRSLHRTRVTTSLVYMVATVVVLLGLLFLPGLGR